MPQNSNNEMQRKPCVISSKDGPRCSATAYVKFYLYMLYLKEGKVYIQRENSVFFLLYHFPAQLIQRLKTTHACQIFP
jgi:hypothetical protein